MKYMNKLLCMLIFALTVIYGCASKDTKAKDAVKKYLFSHLHDFESYQSVEFSDLDSLFTTPYEIDSYRTNKEKLDTAISRYLTYGNEFKYKNENKLLSNQDIGMYRILLGNNRKIIDSIKPYTDSVEKAFRREFIGYEIEHTYRSKTLGGNFKISKQVFSLNKEADSVKED